MNLKCWNISAREIADLKDLPKNWVCVSISEEHGGYYPIGFDPEFKDERVLRVRFTDITAPVEKFNKKFGPISENTAKEIINFVEKHKDLNFIVHCHASISRSSAVCLFLNTIYGHELKENFWHLSEPNAHTLGLLIREYKRGK